jgi:peroxiredoxin Q/BCP
MEACGFRDRNEQFAQVNTVVIGISTDKIEDQKKFAAKENLNFPLFADAGKKAAQDYGVLMPNGKYAQRVTFVIDKQGIVRKVYAVTDIRKHPDEVLSFVKTLN